jgi:hypothetical protein
MIRPDDFDIEIGHSHRGTFVRVTHIPTGNERIADPVAPDAVGRTRDTLIAELRCLLFGPEDIRVEIGRSGGGDFIRVVHLPSGIERSAMRPDSTHEELLDEVLEELVARESNAGRDG